MERIYEDCIAYLEEVRWNGKPKCPYCESTKSSPIKKERRYHCNSCFTSYSVTVGTLFHRTHIDLQKWFIAIRLILNAPNKITIHQLRKEIRVNKNTAAYMRNRIFKALKEEPELLQKIIQTEDFTNNN